MLKSILPCLLILGLASAAQVSADSIPTKAIGQIDDQYVYQVGDTVVSMHVGGTINGCVVMRGGVLSCENAKLPFEGLQQKYELCTQDGAATAKKLADTATALENAQKQIQSLTADLASVKKDEELQKDTIAELQHKNDGLVSSLQAKTAEADKLAASVNQFDAERVSLKNEIATRSTGSRIFEEKYKNCNIYVANMTEKLAAANSRADAKDSECAASLASRDGEMLKLTEHIRSLTAEADSVKKGDASQKDAIAALQHKNDELASSLQAKTAEADKLAASAKQFEDEKTALKNELTTRSTGSRIFEEKYKSCDVDLASKDDEIKKLSSQMQALQSETDLTKKADASQKDAFTALQQKNSELVSQLQAKTAEAGKLSASVKSYDAEIKANETGCASSIANKDGEIKRLSGQVQSLATDADSIKKGDALQKGSIAALQKKNAELVAQIRSRENEVSALNDRIKQYEANEVSDRKLREDLRAFQAKLDSIGNNLSKPGGHAEKMAQSSAAVTGEGKTDDFAWKTVSIDGLGEVMYADKGQVSLLRVAEKDRKKASGLLGDAVLEQRMKDGYVYFTVSKDLVKIDNR